MTFQNGRPSAVTTHCSLCLTALIALLLGCYGGPSTFEMPDIDSQEATDKAMSIYDTDKDGSLGESELEQCPGVKDVLYIYDTDKNGIISNEEMNNRIAAWKNGPAMMTLECRVTLDSRPLAGAIVEFVPEQYLEEWLPTASGTTGPDGGTSIGIPKEYLPSTHQRVRAIYAGTYKIRVTHPDKSIPSRYKTETTLGREVSKETGASPVHVLSLESS